MYSYRSVIVALVLTIACLPTAVQGQLNDVSIVTVDGRTIKGSINALTPQGKLSGPGIPAGLTIDMAQSLTTNIKPVRVPHPIKIRTVAGGRVGVEQFLMADEQVTVFANRKPIKLPLQSLRAAIWNETNFVKDAIKSPSKEFDKVIVNAAGKEVNVEGLVQSVSSSEVKINYEGKDRAIDIAKVNAIITADLGLPPIKGTIATIKTKDGSQWKGRLDSIAKSVLKLKVGKEQLVALDCDQVVSLSVASDRLLFLSDTDPVFAREKTQFTIQRSFQKNKSIEGNVLSLKTAAGKKTEFKKGLGVQSSSELVFKNENGFDRFRAIVGIDSETKGRGDCVVVVLGDDAQLWSKRVRGSGLPESIDVDISGVQQVTLRVDPGEDFDLADHVDWCNARFLKTKN